MGQSTQTVDTTFDRAITPPRLPEFSGDRISEKDPLWEAPEDDSIQRPSMPEPEPDPSNLFGVFGEYPEYRMPQEIYDIMNEYNRAAQGIQGVISDTREGISGYWQGARRDMLDTRGRLRLAQEEARSGFGRAQTELSGVREDVLGRIESGYEDIYKDTKAGYGEALQSFTGRSEDALDLMRLRAFGDQPEYTMAAEQQAAQYASAERGVLERAGGGSSALGALSDFYAQQSAGAQGLAMQQAAQQRQDVGQLAQMQYGVGAQEAALRRDMVQGLAGVRSQGVGAYTGAAASLGGQMADLYSQQGQYMGNLGTQQAQYMGDYSMRLAQGQTQSDIALGQLGVSGYGQAAQMRALGLAGVAQGKDLEFERNQLAPYQAQTNWLLNEAARLDPTATQVDYWGDQIGMNYVQYMQGIAGINQANKDSWNSINVGLNTGINALGALTAGGYKLPGL